VTSLSMATG